MISQSRGLGRRSAPLIQDAQHHPLNPPIKCHRDSRIAVKHIVVLKGFLIKIKSSMTLSATIGVFGKDHMQ